MIYGPAEHRKTSLVLSWRRRWGHPREEGGFPARSPSDFSFSQILSHPLALLPAFPAGVLLQLLRFLGDARPSAFDPAAMCDRLASFGVTGCREVLAAHERCTAEGDGLSALVNALSFPFSASGDLFYPVFLFDDFQYTGKLQGVPEGAMLSILRPYIKSGHYPMFLSGSSPGRVTAALKARGALRHLPDDRSGRALARLLRPPLGAPVRARRVEIPASLLSRASERLGGIPAYQRMLVEEIFFRNAKVPDAVTLENLYAVSVTEGKLNRYWRESSRTPSRNVRGAGARSGSSSGSCATGSRSTTVEGAISLMGPPTRRGRRSSPPSSSRGS